MRDSTSWPCGLSAKTTPGYLLRRSSRLAAAILESRFGDRDLSYTQWLTLMLVRNGDVSNGAELARILGHNSGATTRMIDQLEHRGLVTRQRCGEDRRVVKLALTAEGIKSAEALMPRAEAVWSEFLEDFSGGEVATLIDLLGRLFDKLELLDRQIGDTAPKEPVS